MAQSGRPEIEQDSAAEQAFRTLAAQAGFDPDNRWAGGYADYEWDHLRLLLQAYAIDVAGIEVIEFGCNVGGSSVVLAALGARLTAVDVDPAMVGIAQANVERHGLDARLIHFADTRMMELPSASYDLAVANSVLEYVDPAHLDGVIVELHRLLRPGGRLLICGTASRLALRERHSGRWLINYIPRAFDRWLRGSPQRGLSPLLLLRTTQRRFSDVTGSGWEKGRRLIHGRLSVAAWAMAAIGRVARCSPGWFAPYIELVLRKR